MKKKILVFGDFPIDWPFTKLILDRLSKDFELDYCTPKGWIQAIKNRLNLIFPYKYSSWIITGLLAVRLFALSGRSYKYIFVGFGGFDSIPIAFLIKKFFKAELLYLSVVSKVLTNEFYKASSVDTKRVGVIERKRFELCNYVIFDTPMQLRFIVERLYGMPLESIEGKERFVCIPLIPDKNIFCYSTVPEKKKLKVVWWGQVSKLHGIEFIFHAVKLCGKLPIEFTFIISEDVKTATGQDWDYWHTYLRDANVVIIWWKYGVTHSVQDINEIIKNCHICLGVFNFNAHLNTFYANKEMEAIFLNRLLVTRYRLNSSKFFYGAAVEQVSTPQELAHTLEKYIDENALVDNSYAINEIEEGFNSSLANVFIRKD